MEYIKLIGVLIVIIGFALNLDAILIILLAVIFTGLAGGLGIEGLFDVIGKSFVSNRAMAIFIPILLVTGVLERNGIKEAASNLIGKVKVKSAGIIIIIYGAMRSLLAAFNMDFGGVAGFVKPVVLPMAEAAEKSKRSGVNEEHMEEIKGIASAMENVSWFFFQVLFIGGAGAILVQNILSSLRYEVELAELASVEVPVAVAAFISNAVITYIRDKRSDKKYYSSNNPVKGGAKNNER